jgi:hypothetical protein
MFFQNFQETDVLTRQTYFRLWNEIFLEKFPHTSKDEIPSKISSNFIEELLPSQRTKAWYVGDVHK